MPLSSPEGLLQRVDVELLHPHDRLQDSLRPRGIGIAQHLGQDSWDDLPRHPVLIIQPAAWSGFTARGRLLPHPVQFLLRLAVHGERHGLGERALRPAVERGELLPVQLEPHGQHAALGPRSALAVASDLADCGVLEDGGIEAGGLLRLVIEPQAWCDLLHLCVSWRDVGRGPMRFRPVVS
jgi:hypothetical protein